SGAAAYIGCNTGSQPAGLTLMEGFVDALARGEQQRVAERRTEMVRLGDCVLLGAAAPGGPEAQRRLVPPEHLLSGNEVHGVWGSDAGDAVGESRMSNVGCEDRAG